MAKSSTSVKVPMSLLTKIICLLECLEPEDCDQVIVKDHREIALALKNLKNSVDTHNAFVQILNNSEFNSSYRREQRYNYLQRKRELDLPF